MQKNNRVNMPKITVQHEGNDIEVELPKGYVGPDEIAANYKPKKDFEGMENRLRKKVESEIQSSYRQTLLEDSEFVGQVLTASGVPLDEDGNVAIPEGGMSAEEMQKQLKAQTEQQKALWEKQQLDPMKKSLEQFTSENQALKKRILLSELAEGARTSGVTDAKFEPFPGQGPETAPVYAAASLFDWDKENGQWALKGSDGSFVINPDGTPDRPYVDPASYWGRQKEEKHFKEWFKDNRVSSTGLPGTGPSKGGRDVSSLSESERAEQLQKLRHI